MTDHDKTACLRAISYALEQATQLRSHLICLAAIDQALQVKQQIQDMKDLRERLQAELGAGQAAGGE